MFGVALMLTVATLGVDYGWQPGEDGQMEYIIQIEPELVETLREGKVDLLSEIPPELEGVKRFRIRVGKGPVPRKGLENGQALRNKPGDTVANQQPKLNDPRAQNSATKPGSGFPTNPRAPAGTPGPDGLIDPPPPNNGPLGDPPLPGDQDRFTGGNSRFPTVGQTPGISRNASLPGAQNATGDQMQPLPATPNGVNGGNTKPATSGGNFNGVGTPNNSTSGQVPLNNGAFQQQPGANDRWTGTNNFNTGSNNFPSLGDPRGPLPELNPTDPRYPNDPRYAYDPRYQQPPPGMPEIRQGNLQAPAPNYNGPYRPDQYAWAPPAQPLRDPEASRYAPDPRAYDPMNRQVDYREVATTRGAGTAAATTPPPAATSAVPTTPTKSTSNERLSEDPNNKPWLPLTFTAMLLFASVGLNFYLGWIANGIYIRYRALLMEMRNVRSTALA